MTVFLQLAATGHPGMDKPEDDDDPMDACGYDSDDDTEEVSPEQGITRKHDTGEVRRARRWLWGRYTSVNETCSDSCVRNFETRHMTDE